MVLALSLFMYTRLDKHLVKSNWTMTDESKQLSGKKHLTYSLFTFMLLEFKKSVCSFWAKKLHTARVQGENMK